MESLQTLLRKYPNRIKYGMFILDIFAMMIAIKTYVNYVAIETAINDAIIEQQVKTNELAFTQNFLVHYEKSDYAKFFLEHENNILLDNEYIIKFEAMQQKLQTHTWSDTPYLDTQDRQVTGPKQSWQKFILDKVSR